MDRPQKPAIPDVLDAFADYLDKNPVWGSLHIVLEDGNVGDASVRHCIETADAGGDAEGKRLGEILLAMSKTQRGKLGRVASGRLRDREDDEVSHGLQR